jgi:hypothetical protein
MGEDVDTPKLARILELVRSKWNIDEDLSHTYPREMNAPMPAWLNGG